MNTNTDTVNIKDLHIGDTVRTNIGTVIVTAEPKLSLGHEGADTYYTSSTILETVDAGFARVGSDWTLQGNSLRFVNVVTA